MSSHHKAIDIVLVTSPYPIRDDEATRDIVYFDQCCQLSDGIWLGSLDQELAEAILDACEPRGENFAPVRQFGAPYGLIRLNAAEPKELRFDPDNLLGAVVALSRLAHPTSIGFSYAARVRYPPSGERQIIPGAPINLNPNAFVGDELADWLIPDDAPQIADLVAAYQRQDAPGRVRAAFWSHEAAARNYFVEHRWGMVVTGLEALFHVRNERDPRKKKAAGSTRVFVQRGVQAARELGMQNVTEAQLRDSYGTRSSAVHGAGIGELNDELRERYLMTESLLSRCVQRALLDQTFANKFASDSAVQAAFPLY